MMRAALLALVIFISACAEQQITPAKHTENMRLSIQLARFNCQLYQVIDQLPRDPLLDAKCPALVTGAP